MTGEFAQLLGGLGLFLLGMLVMTDGLRGLAGERLHRWLARFTNSARSGVVTGAATTALLQSSSATTVAAVGFVGAGLLTYTQALGVIFGANLGTTVTGWLVALLGLKLKIASFVFPLILIGALLRLFGRGRWRHAGFALAGFALVFQGIGVLQAGMSAYEGVVTPADFPPDTWSGRLQLVAIGIAITLVTQSSSAGVATALTAVHTGTITFPQAAALVIGMDVGTTVTAALATLGGSVDTRRTGYSHVVYNLLTAIGALLLLSPYVWAWQALAPAALAANAEIALVGFHSLFNLIGVVAVLPFVAAFAALMHRLVPNAHDPLIDRLDPHLLRTPNVALDVVAQTLTSTTRQLFTVTRRLLDGEARDAETLATLARQLDAVHAFSDRIHLEPAHETRQTWRRLNASFHVLDHLQRLHERCDEEAERAARLLSAPRLADEVAPLVTTLEAALRAPAMSDMADCSADACAAADHISARAGPLRDTIMSEVVAGHSDVDDATGRLEGVRWLRRVARHVCRILIYFADVGPDAQWPRKPGQA